MIDNHGILDKDISTDTHCVIREGVVKIEDEAFSDCSNMISIEIPASVTFISGWAFRGCTKLASFETSDLNESYTSIDGILFTKDKKTLVAFPPGKSLSSIVIPKSVTTIGDYAFYECKDLTEIKIPDGVVAIGNNTFSGCIGLSSIVIPTSVSSIGNYAFSGCTRLSSVEINKSDNYYEDSSKSAYPTIIKTLTIGDWAFLGCSNLNTFDISNSISSIGNGVFSGCK